MPERDSILASHLEDLLREIGPVFNQYGLETQLGGNHSLEVVGKGRNTLNLLIDGVKVDVIRHCYPNAKEPIEHEGFKISALEDIAAMKLNAIANRGAKKDFFDLYFLLSRFSLLQLVEWFGEKYRNHDPFFVIQSLNYFDDAEPDPEPVVGTNVTWQEVKEEIRKAVKELGRSR